MMIFQQLAKRLNLGKFIYYLYYKPKRFLKQCVRKGVINLAIDYKAQSQMGKAVYQLQSISSVQSEQYFQIHFLTGKSFWYQSCFCAYSMAQHSPIAINPVFYDDGTLTQKYQNALHRVFPNAQFVLMKEIDEHINAFLPENKFPYLRERRQNYLNLRKLTDIHVGSNGWKLVLDSDMLFFRTPNFLLDWLHAPHAACHMVDVETSYGYSEDLMTKLTNFHIPERVNVGICGVNSSAIDWEKLEYWCRSLIEEQGTHYYQEQALIAMLIADQPRSIAPASDYLVLPDRAEVMNPQAVMHHYVAGSKPWYFRYGWKHILDCNH